MPFVQDSAFYALPQLKLIRLVHDITVCNCRNDRKSRIAGWVSNILEVSWAPIRLWSCYLLPPPPLQSRTLMVIKITNLVFRTNWPVPCDPRIFFKSFVAYSLSFILFVQVIGYIQTKSYLRCYLRCLSLHISLPIGRDTQIAISRALAYVNTSTRPLSSRLSLFYGG